MRLGLPLPRPIAGVPLGSLRGRLVDGRLGLTGVPVSSGTNTDLGRLLVTVFPVGSLRGRLVDGRLGLTVVVVEELDLGRLGVAVVVVVALVDGFDITFATLLKKPPSTLVDLGRLGVAVVVVEGLGGVIPPFPLGSLRGGLGLRENSAIVYIPFTYINSK